MTSVRRITTKPIVGKPGKDGRVEDLRIIYSATGEILHDYRPGKEKKNG